MTEADRQRFSAAMASLGVAFDQSVPAQRMRLYWEALRDLRIGAVEWAVKESIRQLTFFPRAKELRDFAAVAPRPRLPGPTRGEPVGMLEDLTPPEEAKERLAEIARRLNGSFGTSFVVDERRGRPELVSGERR